MRIPRWLSAPDNLPPQQRSNFHNTQLEAIGIGIFVAGLQFLPVFLTRLGATSVQVGLLTSIQGVGGLLLTIPVGRFLQGRRNIAPWYSIPRLVTILGYAAIALLPLLLPEEAIVTAVLVMRALLTIPQTLVFVSFSVLMNTVSGPRGRYELLSRRWATLSLTVAIMSTVAGQILNRLPFPLNYQVVFLGLALGGWISYYYAHRIQVPDAEAPAQAAGLSWKERLSDWSGMVRGEHAFLSFTARRFVYYAGLGLALPLFPLYYVRIVQASDAWIGTFNTVYMLTVLLGYGLWTRLSDTRGPRFVLLSTTLAFSFYPALVASTNRAEHIVLYTGLAGIFAAGLDLVFFDELMKTVPVQYAPTFVALYQILQHFSDTASPLLGTALAERIGLSGALVAAAALRLIGFLLFAQGKRVPSKE